MFFTQNNWVVLRLVASNVLSYLNLWGFTVHDYVILHIHQYLIIISYIILHSPEGPQWLQISLHSNFKFDSLAKKVENTKYTKKQVRRYHDNIGTLDTLPTIITK